MNHHLLMHIPININCLQNKTFYLNYFHSNYLSSQLNQYLNSNFLYYKTYIINDIFLHTNFSIYMKTNSGL